MKYGHNSPITVRPVRAIKNAVKDNGGVFAVRNALPFLHPLKLKRHTSIDRMLSGMSKPELEQVLAKVRA